MSFMTTKLRYVVEQALDDRLLDRTEANWPQIYDELGLADYPIFSGDAVTTGPCEERTRLNDKLIRTYYMREIGLETVALFRWYLRSALLNIMPYYNQLYYSASLITEPLREYDETETEKMEEAHTEDGQSTDTAKTEVSGETDETRSTGTTTSSTNIYSETPENLIPSGGVKNLNYATTVTYDDTTQNVDETGKTTDTRTTDDTRSGTNKVEYDGNRTTGREKLGRRSSQMQLVQQYREAILNIDRMVIEDEEVATCFMLVYE